VILLPAGNPSRWTGPTGNNTYLLPGTVTTLIDAGVGDAGHLNALWDALGGAALAQILITHAHPDHTKGLPALLERYPSAVVRNISPHSCTDGDQIAAGDTVLRAIHTPGHSPDHFCFFDERSRDLYCGDLARLGGTIVIPASAGGNLKDYLQSLERVRDLAPVRLLPGHGPIVTDPGALIDAYVAHRLERERQIAALLGQGFGTVTAIVERLYGPLPADLARAASETVRAHLIKLVEDARADERDGVWRLS
jgi:glyoxylase-like metal-dependent hydrolase (beta-lactamase superfamily II)